MVSGLSCLVLSLRVGPRVCVQLGFISHTQFSRWQNNPPVDTYRDQPTTIHHNLSHSTHDMTLLRAEERIALFELLLKQNNKTLQQKDQLPEAGPRQREAVQREHARQLGNAMRRTIRSNRPIYQSQMISQVRSFLPLAMAGVEATVRAEWQDVYPGFEEHVHNEFRQMTQEVDTFLASAFDLPTTPPPALKVLPTPLKTGIPVELENSEQRTSSGPVVQGKRSVRFRRQSGVKRTRLQSPSSNRSEEADMREISQKTESICLSPPSQSESLFGQKRHARLPRTTPAWMNLICSLKLARQSLSSILAAKSLVLETDPM